MTKKPHKWTALQRKNFLRTIAIRKKTKVKRSGVIPFDAIPDAPKPKNAKSAHTKISSYEEKYTAKQVIALIKELMK